MSASQQGMSAKDILSTDEADREVQKYNGEIFCNRALNMKNIGFVGFDMDYTLAQYIPETFEILAHRGAMAKLVESMDYPAEILKLDDYDPTYFQRGLIIDKMRGNIIKMDRHSYVKLAFHGNKMIDREERLKIYGNVFQKSFTSKDYANIDTLFSLPDAFMYAQLVDFKDANEDKYPMLKGKSYEQMYKDVRRSVDLCHRDGVIKDRVSEDPGKYIQAEPGIVDMIKRLKLSGRKVFLLTNSLWDYTNVVMNHICGNSQADSRNLEWLDLFDLVIVGACKPGFLDDPQLSLFRVHPESDKLSNMDNALFDPPELSLSKGKVFQGGNYNHLHHLLGNFIAGPQIMYVGDHMFSDVIRGKRSLGWRTMLVVPELEHEVNVWLQQSVRHRRIEELAEMRHELDEWVDRLSLLIVSCNNKEECVVFDRIDEIEAELAKAREELQTVKNLYASEVKEFHEAFHPVWGQVFKVGYQNSRFAQQVENYACLYTSKVSNFGMVSPEMIFRTQQDVMPHDQLEDTPIRRLLKSRGDSFVRSLTEMPQRTPSPMRSNSPSQIPPSSSSVE
eukprot:CAMPEP_0173435748 /NCGR_PEP_ID=MMETSP1357-20121228/15566_1 /TAXON_ID=77926 /ORGANISM="Hemiselmis rufescens, Strain PCC563" /LENGTH=560 /DNA_ID=CAMNT_0014400767 /DNA_START=257 /DNA_END=1939 /DNA_ORIENTATION=+